MARSRAGPWKCASIRIAGSGWLALRSRTGTEPEVLVDDWRAPLDEWFCLVLGVRNGASAEPRLRVFDAKDRLVGERR